MSTQHCIRGFSWWSKARKQERKKKSRLKGRKKAFFIHR